MSTLYLVEKVQVTHCHYCMFELLFPVTVWQLWLILLVVEGGDSGWEGNWLSCIIWHYIEIPIYDCILCHFFAWIGIET